MSKEALLAFALAGLLLSVKADGRFPLPASLPELELQLLLLPYTCAFVGTLVWSLFGTPRPIASGAAGRALRRLDTRPLVLAVALIYEVLTALVLVWQARKYAPFGYRLDTGEMALAFAVPALGLGWLARTRSWTPGHLFVVSAVSYLAVGWLSLRSFPLTAGRSDMLPLIAAAGERLLQGESPYGLYALPHSVPLTYLPGLLLAYLPAVATGIDPRIVHMAATMLAATLALRVAPRQSRLQAAGVASAFMLLPYSQYRHEIYLGPHWMSLALMFLLLARDQALAASAVFGWSLAMSQFTWVLAPVYFVHLWKSRGPAVAILGAATALGVALAMVLPFLLWAPQEFLRGTFGHWEATVNLTTANVSYWLLRFLPIGAVRLLQCIAVAACTTLSWRSGGSLGATGRWMAVTLTAFVLLNPLIWVYFYLTVLFLALLALSAERPERTGQPTSTNARDIRINSQEV